MDWFLSGNEPIANSTPLADRDHVFESGLTLEWRMDFRFRQEWLMIDEARARSV